MIDKISYKQRHAELKILQNYSLNEKIIKSNQLIDRILNNFKKPAIAWSGGRDSTTVLYLVLKKKPDIDVIWINTGVEFPECVKFIRDIKSKWSLNFHVAKPKKTFWETVDKYGWPMLGKGGSGYWWSRAAYLRKKGRIKLAKATEVAKISAACCRILKEKPMKDLCSSLGIDSIILGNIVSESRQRFLIWAQKGDLYYAKNEKRWKAWILAYWTKNDILRFHKLYNLPMSSIYRKGHLRNGCWPCLMDIRFKDNKLKILRKSHPKLWKFLILKKGLGKRLLALKLVLNDKEITKLADNNSYIEQIIEKRPCFFDSINN